MSNANIYRMGSGEAECSIKEILGFYISLCLWATLGMTPLTSAAALSDNRIAGPLNGHYYELVESDSGVNWFEAKAAAEERTHRGLRGYLATITTAVEYSFVTSSFPRVEPEYVWLGASDEQYEGSFKWITGESAGFGIGINGIYEAWDAGEPSGGTYENCLDFSDGSIGWNDESCQRRLSFYLVEYSAPILDTYICHGLGGSGMATEPDAYGVVGSFSVDFEDDCLGPEPGAVTIFDDTVVPYNDVPRYLNASNLTHPEFPEFVSALSNPQVCVYMLYDVVDPVGQTIVGGGGCGWSHGPVGQRVDRIELLVGDEAHAYFDAEKRVFYNNPDFTVTLYGASAISLEVDVRPGNASNVLNWRSAGRFWVAILSTSDFDALQVNGGTVKLGPAGASPDRYRVKDVNRDRLPDLMLRFRTPEVGLQCGDTELELTGETYAGESIVGTDAVKIIGCKKPKKGKKK